jgi:hypothetical protein
MASAITQLRLPRGMIGKIKCYLSETQIIHDSDLPKEICNLNPHFFAYGQFPLYLAYLSDLTFRTIFQGVTFSSLQNTSTANEYFASTFDSAIIWLRIISTLASITTIYLVFLLTKKVTSTKFALLASLMIAFIPGLIQSAHFGTTESLLSCFYIGSVYFSIRIFEKSDKKDFTEILKNNSKFIILYSLFLGLAIGSKLTGLFLFIPLFLGFIYRSLIFIKNIKTKKKILTSYLFITFFISVLGIFISLIVSFYNIIDTKNFLSAVFGYERDVATGKYEAFYTRQFVNSIPVIFQMKNIFPYVLGLPIFIGGIFGFLFISIKLVISFFKRIIQKKGLKKIYAFLDQYLAIIILTISFLIFLLPNAFLYAKWSRFMTPILPFFVIFYAIILEKIYSHVININSKLQVKNKSGASKPFTSLVIGVMVLISLIPGIAFMSIYASKDSRVLASEWIYENIPSDAYILSETGNVIDIPVGLPGYDDKEIPKNLKIVSFDFYHLDQNPNLFGQLINHLYRADYIFIPSRRIFANYPLQPEKFPLVTKYYQLLFSGKLGYEKIHEIYSFPRLSIGNLDFLFPDEVSEETFTVFDHPVIRIFKKKINYNALDYLEMFNRDK